MIHCFASKNVKYVYDVGEMIDVNAFKMHSFFVASFLTSVCLARLSTRMSLARNLCHLREGFINLVLESNRISKKYFNKDHFVVSSVWGE